jgi:predicted Fe-Mo cluster-binding NifX family protein
MWHDKCLELDMKVAIPQWQGRVSPVFDVAGSLLLIYLGHGVEIDRKGVALVEDTFWGRARRMAGLGIDTLICGAISRPLELALLYSGIEVISQICGDVDQVLEAYMKGRMRQEMFFMPGCRGWQMRHRRGRRNGGRP